MKKPKYMTKDGTPLSLSNLYFRNESSVMEIMDVVEDATNAVELMDGLNRLNLFEKFRIDRTTDTYVRLKSTDSFGNIRYFKAEFDTKLKHSLDKYYTMADNYLIPADEMTPQLMAEVMDFIKNCPFEEGGYLLMYCPKEVGYDEPFWCITSWVE